MFHPRLLAILLAIPSALQSRYLRLPLPNRQLLPNIAPNKNAEAVYFGPLTDSLDEFAVSGKKVRNSL